MKRLSISLISVFISLYLAGQSPWEVSSFPGEEGFQLRMQPMLERIAAKGFGERIKALSKCPDTGLPVRTLAVEGETIFSTYTGRAYVQGETGYFGPKARNANGEIIAFGGDPLKYDLPPATAALLLNGDNQMAKAFLGIPGNMRQQYHFACKNWARFYPLAGNLMGDAWKSEFYGWIGRYAEARRPSDGDRENAPLPVAHNLVGEPGKLLGGNPLNGGTENHKTMWRTSGLLYSQLLPDTAKVSGYPVKEAEKLTMEMLRDYLKRLLITGNGEYDSHIYYPHSIEGFLNLYDFSPDEETRQLAKFALDFYFVTYGLKVIDGAIAGPQKRGYLTGSAPGEMETMLWAFFGNLSRDMENTTASIQQVTTTYRPNRVIYNIVNKNLEVPFEAKMSRPFYHMDHPHAFAEYFFCSESYAMGNTQMTIVDNPNQQMVWSLVSRGTDGPLCFSGGHPMRGSTSGHSPYTQTFQSKGTLMLLTAPTHSEDLSDSLLAPNYSKAVRENLWLLPESEQGGNYEIKNRNKYAAAHLHPVGKPAGDSPSEIERFWSESKGSASSWFYYPRHLVPKLIDGVFYFEAGEMYIAVIPLEGGAFVLAPPSGYLSKPTTEAQKFFRDYSLLVFPGTVSGYIVETAEKSAYPTLREFTRAIVSAGKPALSKTGKSPELSYRTPGGDLLRMEYRPVGLRCNAFVNGEKQDWENYTNGAVYESPYLKVKDGIMKVTDGREGYEVDFRGERPLSREMTTE